MDNLQQSIKKNLEKYFADLNGLDPSNVHQMVINLIEKPMLEVVMLQAENNQTKAAKWLGLNRNTLRKKLQQHQLLD